jgi:dihydrofolate reductase
MEAIAAMARNRVIGNGDKLPWHSEEDLAFFKEKTMGQQLIMGRKTFESLTCKLKGRIIWVLNTKKYDGDVDWENREGYVYTVKTHYLPQDGIVCGGASVYKQFLPKCEKLYLTVFDFDADGDVFMPDFERIFSTHKLIREISNGKIYEYTHNALL